MSLHSGLWLVGVMCLASKLFANPTELNWVVEQLAQPPIPLYAESQAFQSQVSAVNFADAVSVQGSVLYDVGFLELGGKYSGRFFPQLSNEGAVFRRDNFAFRQSYGFLLGKTYLTRDNHYGRFSAEWTEFKPARSRFLRVGANTGILDTPSMPWILRINFHVFLAISGWDKSDGIDQGKIYHCSTEIGQNISIGKASTLRLGGMLAWTYRTREIPEDVGHVGPHYEHMLFSLGPWAEFGNSTSRIRLAIPWRISLNKEIFTRVHSATGAILTSARYPNESHLPDVSLAWVLSL